MPLPQGFSATEHWQDTIARIYNKEIREWFSDITTDDLATDTARNSLRTACLHQENDSVSLTLGRMMLFEKFVGERWRGLALATSSGSASPHSVYRRNKPRVVLFFLEDLDDVDPDYAPVSGEIGFRLMDETAATLTQSKMLQLANRIRTEFAQNGGYVWRKGKDMASYTDWEKGYQLQVLCRNRNEAKALIDKVLDVRSDSPDWEYLNYSENDQPTQAFPTVPPNQSVGGELRRMSRRRPIASVRFQFAKLELEGFPNPIILFDRSGAYPNALVT
jgi:hypothetical protein